LKDHFLYKFTNWLWGAIALFCVLLALYISVGRFLTSNVAVYQTEILRELNARLDFVLEADDLRGSWSYLTPHLELRGLRLLGDRHAPVALQMDELKLGFDVLETLRTLRPQLISMSGTGLRLHADLEEGGSFSLPGIPPGGSVGLRLLRFILNTQRLQLEDVVVSLHQDERFWDIHSSLKLRRDEDFRRFNMSVLTPSQQSWFRVVAEGVGEPTDFASFAAGVHVRLFVPEAEQFSDLTELAGVVVSGGKLEGELWLNLEPGELRSAADFSAVNLRMLSVSDPDRPIQLEELSATVRADYGEDGWTFGASNVLARDPKQEFSLATANAEYGDGRLLLRTSEVDISRLCLYLTEENLLPRNLENVVATLKPAGDLKRLQLVISDTTESMESWELSANFEDLAVESWRGAPVLERAAGYLRMDAGTGLVQLRSQDLGMGFPKLYEHMLDYDEFEAELRWQVGRDWFRLYSGPFHGVGEEGEVQGLFSLTAPLQPSLVGPEMELMVGLSDAHPRHRSKYLPYTMSEKLLDWLGDSIGEGRISDGGFIWRGSLRKGAKAMRTIQAYFNVAETELVYHPDWPPLSEIEGNIVIDDVQVDVWAARARLYDSMAENVTVSLRQDQDLQLILAVDANVTGDAGDGLMVVNQSPLRKLVGDSFIDWRLRGDLQTRLQLEMNLSDPEVPPRVDLQTVWDQVELDTGPIGLVIEGITGILEFDSSTGFRADDLRGTLWQQAITAQVRQGGLGDGLDELDIAISGTVRAEDLRGWLNLDLLRLASGAAPAEMHIRIPPGEGARLEIGSDLQGIELDLPGSFAKEADTARALELGMPLAGSPRKLELKLGDAMYLDLLLGEGGYEGGALGFGSAPQPLESGTFTITGRLEHLAWESWSGFVDNYVGLGDSSYTAGLLLAVRDLSVGELEALGLSVRDVELDAQQLDDSWKLEFMVPWMKGSLSFPFDLSSAELDLDRLDLAGIDPELQNSVGRLEDSGDEMFILPPAEVTIAELSDREGRWGDLAFAFRQEGKNYHLDNIRGNMRGLLLGGEEELRLEWIRGEHVSSTRVQGPLRFLNFGDVLAHYGYDQVIETNSGVLDLDLAWPGGPTEFTLGQTTGSMGVKVDEGRFLKTSSAAEGTLRVVGIMNLAEFVRRLSLDLNYLFKSGVAFDSITGEVLFQEGMIEVPQMDVLGRSSRFQFAGLFDVAQESIAGELVATLPVASNLPWIAALIGGLPAAAGVFVVSKVFTKQVDRFSSGVYSISGPWGDPEVKFERIFDNTATHQKAVASGKETPAEPPEEPPPG
jgi:uncharacterized protein (TIGR02099 family)